MKVDREFRNYLIFDEFEQFRLFLTDVAGKVWGKLPTIQADVIECAMAFISTDWAEEVPLGESYVYCDWHPFPVVRVTLKVSCPARRTTDEGRAFDEVRFEEVFLTRSDSPPEWTRIKMRTLSEFREKLERAEWIGFQISFESETAAKWLREKV